jgi:uncharacterized phage-like protein YoqJ
MTNMEYYVLTGHLSFITDDALKLVKKIHAKHRKPFKIGVTSNFHSRSKDYFRDANYKYSRIFPLYETSSIRYAYILETHIIDELNGLKHYQPYILNVIRGGGGRNPKLSGKLTVYMAQ